MNTSNQRKSGLQIQKLVERSLNTSQNWLDPTKFYSSNGLFNILILAALERSSVEDLCNSSVLNKSSRAPSPDTVLRALKHKYGSMGNDDLGDQVATVLQHQVSKLPFFKQNNRPRVQLALDLHDEEYFGKDLFDQSGNRLVFYTNKYGKSRKALRYATLSIVAINNDCHQPLTIGFGINYVGQPRLDVVKKLLEQIDLDFKIDLLLMDGGFANVDILEYLDWELIPWITRGKYIKKKRYVGNPGDPYFFPYYLKREYMVLGYLIDRKVSKEKEEIVLLFSSMFKPMSPTKCKQLYRRRFRIENNYRHARVIKIRTSTRNIQLRWILWAISHFLELIWELISYHMSTRGYKKYDFRQKEVNRIIKEVLYEGLRLIHFLLDNQLINEGGN